MLVKAAWLSQYNRIHLQEAYQFRQVQNAERVGVKYANILQTTYSNASLCVHANFTEVFPMCSGNAGNVFSPTDFKENF